MERMMNEYTQGCTLDYEVYTEAVEEVGSEEELMRIVEERTGEPFFVGFTDWNCEDECRGWNGCDRRCDCGNRRVEWDDETMAAEAY